MTLATIFNKTTSAWAVSNNNGGLDTGAIANATTYHLFLIRRPDTGLIDVLFSLSPTAPTMPASYTQFRRIGAARTTGAAQWIKFIQQDDKFLLDVWVTDISAVNPGIAAVTRTLASVPTGIIVDALMNVYTQNIAAVGAASALISALSISDQAVGSNISNVTASAANAGNTGNPNANISVLTNTSAQVRSRLSFSDASVTLNITTIGWIDSRGRNN